MSVLLQVKDICKSYGATKILINATASFQANQKIGVIGRNGAGKSTLCKIITGEMEKDSGQIIKNRELRLSYLEQHDSFKPEETVVDFLTRYTGREEWECGEMAAKFQIDYDMLYKPMESLAGGYRTRVKLAGMLLGDPNFLILDEPSNYLDLSTLILLENFLINFNGGYLIVSHDREFLKKTCEYTLEVEQSEVTLFPGAVEDYFEFKEEQLRHKEAYNKNVEKKREQLQNFVDRMGAKASQATRAKSKMKQIEKLETIDIKRPLSNVKIYIPPAEPKAGIALSCDALAIGYPTKLVVDDIHLSIDRGKHVAVLGDNGQGKTTFFKTITGDLEAKGGVFRWGTGLKLGYYAQHVFQTLHPEDTILQHLQREAVDGITQQQILDMAGSFLFKGDDVKKKVKVLSGGERARLCLAGLLLTKAHVLLLDEPTNHLDFETVEALANALKEYSGTIFFISHDRTFVNLLATQILDIKDGKIKRYPGTYEEYVYHLECQAREIYGEKPGPKPKKSLGEKKSQSHKSTKSHEDKSNSAGQGSDEELKRKEVKKKISELRIKMKKCEKKISHWTSEKERLAEDIQKNPFHYSKDRAEKLSEAETSLAEYEEDWIKFQEKLEKLENKLKS